MKTRGSVKVKLVLLALMIGLAALIVLAKTRSSPVEVSSPTNHSLSLPPALLLPSSESATEKAIQYFTARVTRDPEETRSQNALSEYYLQRLRETGNEDFLPPALAAARASLSAVAAEANPGGLAAQARAEFANHDFASARDHALRLAELDGGKSEPYAILGDALLELGEYERAAEAFQHMQRLGEDSVGTQTRLARLSFLQGHSEQSREYFLTALRLLLASPSPPREAVAWCHWQLGETAFSTGDYKTAERHYRDTLTTAPGYFRALAALGRLSAAHGDWAGASAKYQEAIRATQAHDFVAALGDIFRLRGQEASAAALHGTIEQMAEHTLKVHGTAHNRNLALFYADHDLKPEQAYALAAAEYATRKDIYGADALAWTALKAGRVQEAQAAIKEALRLGTQDARLFYHAGMIARAGKDKSNAKQYLKRTLALNPQFDPLQAARAREALKNL